ncbi:MAG TPA: hypothetical protein VHY35_03775 [Stellaceae bacterium]|jgi:hypothetical protein|nr:hypothetical protein [Stellaceae bacterium]
MADFTREALYELVWTDPVRTVAARFGMSDVAFRKHCVRAAVPLPERGYWAKVAAGRKVPKIALPPRAPCASNVIQIGSEPYNWRYDPEAELAKPVPSPPQFQEPIEAVKARVAARVRKVPFIRELAEPLEDIRKLLDEDAKRAERQRTDRWAMSWDKPCSTPASRSDA